MLLATLEGDAAVIRIWVLVIAMVAVLLVSPAGMQSKASTIRVGVQAGHWKIDELPDELARLHDQTVTWAAGISEVDVNLDIAERVVAQLQAHGITADLLPATVPAGYSPDLFIALHADGSTDTTMHGFKAARSRWRAPADAARDDRLVETLYDVYGRMTGLPEDQNISRGMTGYYAFNSQRHTHAIPATTPGVILEMGFLTNPGDRAFMTTQQNLIAEAITTALITFLNEDNPTGAKQETAPLPSNATVQGSLVVATYAVNVREGPGTRYERIMVLYQYEGYLILDSADGWYKIWLPAIGVSGWVRSAFVAVTG